MLAIEACPDVETAGRLKFSLHLWMTDRSLMERREKPPNATEANADSHSEMRPVGMRLACGRIMLPAFASSRVVGTQRASQCWLRVQEKQTTYNQGSDHEGADTLGVAGLRR